MTLPSSITTATVLGYPITTLALPECVTRITGWVRETGPVRHVACANPHSIVTARRDPEFAAAMQAADLLVPDGTGVALAARWLGHPIRTRITGSDIFARVNAAMDQSPGMTCFFLGSTDETLDAIRSRMARDFGNVRIVGCYAPPFRNEFLPEDHAAMVDAVNRAAPDILWIGMTQPKQEKWVQQNRIRIRTKVAISVGAVFDFYSGRVRRPGPLFRAMGLEWFPRLLREPRRLWRRNLDSVIFLGMVLRERTRRHT